MRIGEYTIWLIDTKSILLCLKNYYSVTSLTKDPWFSFDKIEREVVFTYKTKIEIVLFCYFSIILFYN